MLARQVLLMQFVGHDGFAAPRLKDAHLSDEHAEDACVQVCPYEEGAAAHFGLLLGPSHAVHWHAVSAA